MKKFAVLTVLALCAVAGAGEFHRHFHIHQTSLDSFVVTCDNGADPTGKDIGTGKSEIEISCVARTKK